MTRPFARRLLYLASALLLTLACNTFLPDPTPTRPPFQSAAQLAAPSASTNTADTVVVATPIPTTASRPPLAAATAVPDVWTVAVAPGVPGEVAAGLQQLALNDARFALANAAAGAADVVIAVGQGAPLAHWTYVPAAAFPTVADATTLDALRQAWSAPGGAPLLVSSGTAAALATVWGAPGAGVDTRVAAELVDAAWGQRSALAILPFHRLDPRLKSLALDEHAPLAPGLADAYPLRLVIGATGDETAVAALRNAWPGPTTNRDEKRLTRVAMTGVTALVRATAHQMELQGILYPGEEVAPVMQTADITHLSNEVSFSPDCPYPDPVGGTSFCSRDSYFELIKMLGVDVVELTGNHLNDQGAENLTHSMAMYEAAGMATFGGGRDLAESQKPATFEHNGNRIAFVGCNPVGPAYAWATATRPGSLPCSGVDLTAQIAQLTAEGFLVFATLQYWEHYSYPATAQQTVDFRELAAAGAVAVSGSQGHHAQGFAFLDSAFIHYGLGNLFFDQMFDLGTRQTFVDTYVIYDGRVLGVELWTGLIENFARPRVMTPAERAGLLETVFRSSGW